MTCCFLKELSTTLEGKNRERRTTFSVDRDFCSFKTLMQYFHLSVDLRGLTLESCSLNPDGTELYNHPDLIPVLPDRCSSARGLLEFSTAS